MANVFTNRTTDFDGSGSPITATGSVAFNVTGTLGKAEVKVYVSLDSSTTFNMVSYVEDPSYFIVELPSSGATFYVEMTSAESGTTNANCDYQFM